MRSAEGGVGRVTGVRGFSLIELIVALGLASVGLAAMALLSSGVLGTFAAEPAAAEQQQRARATLAVIADDVSRAGTGFLSGPLDAPGWGAPALVSDRVRTGAWPVGVLAGTLGVLGGQRTAAHARLAVAVAAGESRLVLVRPGYCAPASPTCRFAAGDDVVLSGAHGAFALATVRAAAPPLILDLTAPLLQAWPAGTLVSAAHAPAYVVRDDPGTGVRLIARAQGAGPASVLVDFVDQFAVEWLIAGTPAVREAPDGTVEATTAGPLPPPAGVIGDPFWPAGENCVFARDAAGRAVSRLAPLGAVPIAASPAQFADGPWCPSPAAPVRWDADLVRVVGVRVRLDVVVAAETLRVGVSAPGARVVPRLSMTAVLAPGRHGATP